MQPSKDQNLNEAILLLTLDYWHHGIDALALRPEPCPKIGKLGLISEKRSLQ